LNIVLDRNRVVALVAACALALCAAVYSAHGFGERGHEHAHCDLCVHFSGTAGSPLPPTVVGKPVLEVRVSPAPPRIYLPLRSPLGEHLPRGPPQSAVI
jgi:hypothetical protein